MAIKEPVCAMWGVASAIVSVGFIVASEFAREHSQALSFTFSACGFIFGLVGLVLIWLENRR